MKLLRIPSAILLIASALFFPVLFTQAAYADCVNPNQASANAASNPPTVDESGTVLVTTQVTCGGDDVPYQVAVPSSIIFAGVTYQAVYATTNSVITFGNPDGTYWTYPNTPSLSIGSQDWVAYPSQYPDEHFIITTSALGFQIDLAARPYANQNISTLTTIITTAIINADTTLSITYLVDNLPDGTRTGARLPTGQIVTLEQAGVIQVDVAPIAPGLPDPTPTPSDTPTATASPTPTPSDTPTATPTPEPVPVPVPVPTYEPPPIAIPDPPVVVVDIPVEEPPLPPIDEELPPMDDTPVVETLPPDEPAIEPPPVEEPPVEEPPVQEVPIEEPPVEEVPVVEPPIEQVPVEEPPAEEPLTVEEQTVVAVAALLDAVGDVPVTAQAVADAGLTYADLPPQTPIAVREDAQGNEVVITAEVAVALELLASPSELVTAIFTNPSEALLAVASIGADMSTEERTQSTKAVVATVIAAGAAINAVGAASNSTRTPSSGGGGGGVSADSKGVRRRKP